MSAIQGLDTIPQGILQEFGSIFRDLLPDWRIDGEYNFQAGASTQKASAQLGVLMQNGSHPWINNQITALLRSPEFAGIDDDDLKRVRLAQLINFMSDASSPQALGAGPSKTGGFIAFSSRSDPNLLKMFGGQPTTAQMGSRILKEGADGIDSRFRLSWDKIVNSVSGQEVAALNIREVNGRVTWTGSTSNRSFFSKTADAISEFEVFGGSAAASTQFSRKWASAEGVKTAADGSILKNGVAVRAAEAEALFTYDQEDMANRGNSANDNDISRGGVAA